MFISSNEGLNIKGIQFEKGKLYIIKKEFHLQLSEGKRVYKKKGIKKATPLKSFATKYVCLNYIQNIIEKNVRELFVNDLKKSYVFSSTKELTNSHLNNMYCVSILSRNPLDNVENFILYLMKLCKFDINKTVKKSVNAIVKGKVCSEMIEYYPKFEPSILFLYYTKYGNPLMVSLPTIKTKNGQIKIGSIKEVKRFLESANYLFN